MDKLFPPMPHDVIEWVGDSKKRLLEFPEDVRRAVGFALRWAQAGEKVDAAKPLRGYKGAGVLELVEDDDGDTYRAVYTVKFEGVVYVLHCFKKKSKSGIKTPKAEIDLVENRLKTTKQHYEEHYRKKRKS